MSVNRRNNSLQKPTKFWEIRCHDSRDSKGVSGLCVGYEQKNWRSEAFASYVMEWLPEFSLNSKERDALNHADAVSKLRKAAQLVYKTGKFKKRGEFGEIFLHAAVRTIFDSVPAISKIYYKSSTNETVKGFDCVHVVGPLDNLELWLGEVKFYKSIQRAITDVIGEINDHLEHDFLKDEFVLISNRLDASDDYQKEVMKLLSSRASLDNIFKRVCVPVLLTYESDAVKNHREVCDEYVKAFEAEIKAHFEDFSMKAKDIKVRFHLFLLPLEDKEELTKIMDGKLKAVQSI